MSSVGHLQISVEILLEICNRKLQLPLLPTFFYPTMLLMLAVQTDQRN